MPKRPPPEIAAYLAKAGDAQRAALLKLRGQVLAVMPDATERMSYQIPTFAHEGRVIVHMAAFRDHCSFFGGYLAAEIARANPGPSYRVKGSTVQFDPAKGLPTPLVRKIVKACLARATKKAPAMRRSRKAAAKKVAAKKVAAKRRRL